MSDLEITKACAEAMELNSQVVADRVLLCLPPLRGYIHLYDPLHDDAQAMAMVKKFWLEINSITEGEWLVYASEENGLKVPDIRAESKDLNRAICECVAKLSTRTVSS